MVPLLCSQWQPSSSFCASSVIASLCVLLSINSASCLRSRSPSAWLVSGVSRWPRSQERAVWSQTSNGTLLMTSSGRAGQSSTIGLPLCLAAATCMLMVGRRRPMRRLHVIREAAGNPLRLPQEDPYAVMGVPRDSEKSEVRKVFRKLVQTEHPDVKKDDPDATAKFQELVSAYNAIMGDQILPDEMMYVRIYNTPRYQKSLKKQVNIKAGYFYTLLPGLVFAVLAGIYVVSDALGVADPQTKQMLEIIQKQKQK